MLRYRELDHTVGKWQTRREVPGQVQRQKDALKASELIMAQVNEGNHSGLKKLNAKITFKEFVESYRKPYTVKKKLQSSSISQRNVLPELHLLPLFCDKLIQGIQPSDISKFFHAKADKEYSDNTMVSF
jgi:hypothetical protein